MAENVTIIINNFSGSGSKPELTRILEEEFATHGLKAHFLELGKDTKLAEKCKELADKGHLITAAGGDGTINYVAGICYKQGITLGVIPTGTFNYFAREMNIPLNTKEAVATIAAGSTARAVIGTVGEYIFLNNASLGLYTKVIKNREKDKSLFGRFRLVAIISAVYCLLRGQRPIRLSINIDEKPQTRLTPMVFIGNNTLQLSNLGLDIAACTKANQLGVAVMPQISRLSMAKLLFLGMIKNMSNNQNLESFCATNFEVNSNHGYMDVVVDGEIKRMTTPLRFAVSENALSVYAPQKTEDA